MKFFFIEKETVVKLTILTLLLFSFGNIGISFLWLICFALFLFLFRRNRVLYKDTLSNPADIFLAPVSGKVIEVIKDVNDEFLGAEGTKIRMAIPWWTPFGLYLPVTASLSVIEIFRGSYTWRFRKSLNFSNGTKRHCLALQTKAKYKLFLEILKCPLGMNPRIWMQVGDKGRTSACFGFLPLGGSVILTIPLEGTVMVNSGDKIKAGETVLAGVKG